MGTLTLQNSLSLATGSELDYEMVAPGNNDVIDVSTLANKFTLNGGAFNLLAPGGTVPFADPGTYQLIKFSGTIQGTGLQQHLDDNQRHQPACGGPSTVQELCVRQQRRFPDSNHQLNDGHRELDGNEQQHPGQRATNPNWNNSTTPGVQGDTAIFGSGATRFLVNLDVSRTVGGITFNSPTSYTIAPGSGGTLFMDESTATANIVDSNGSHLISAPISLTSSTIGGHHR